MADPTIYEPGYDFTATDKGADLNTELDNIAASVTSLAAAIADIRRSDGKLQNQIVTSDALDAVSLATLASEISVDLEAQLEVALASAEATAVASAGSASAAATSETNAEVAAVQATDAAVAAVASETAAAVSAVSADASAVAAAATLAASRFAFSARKSADQTGIVAATATKLTFPTEIFDFGGYYDAANSRFTPGAGKYRLSVGAGWSTGIVDGRQVTVEVWKNGAVFRVFGSHVGGVTDNALVSGACLVEANGTDYFEAYGTAQGTGSKTVVGTVSVTFFEGEAI